MNSKNSMAVFSSQKPPKFSLGLYNHFVLIVWSQRRGGYREDLFSNTTIDAVKQMCDPENLISLTRIDESQQKTREINSENENIQNEDKIEKTDKIEKSDRNCEDNYEEEDWSEQEEDHLKLNNIRAEMLFLSDLVQKSPEENVQSKAVPFICELHVYLQYLFDCRVLDQKKAFSYCRLLEMVEDAAQVFKTLCDLSKEAQPEFVWHLSEVLYILFSLFDLLGDPQCQLTTPENVSQINYSLFVSLARLQTCVKLTKQKKYDNLNFQMFGKLSKKSQEYLKTQFIK